MAKDRQPAGTCPDCGGANLACSYNHFAGGDLVIDSWEHRCPDCGSRRTQAFRTDDPASLEGVEDPRVCPWCGRHPRAAE